MPTTTVNYQMRNPAEHPEDIRELDPMYQQLMAGNLVTAAYIGLVPEGGTGPVRVFLGTKQSDLGATPPLTNGPSYLVDAPVELLPFAYLWQVVGASDAETVFVTDLQGNEVLLNLTRYEEPVS